MQDEYIIECPYCGNQDTITQREVRSGSYYCQVCGVIMPIKEVIFLEDEDRDEDEEWEDEEEEL